MAHKTLVNGTFYEVKGGRTPVDGTGYEIKGGRTLIGATGYDVPFGKTVGEVPVGSMVYLKENGKSVGYVVIQQGTPGALYDASCDGCWLMRKEVCSDSMSFGSYNDYANSNASSHLNSTFYGLFSANMQSAIKQVKIPYRPGQGYDQTASTGANGLSTRIFLLCSAEVNLSSTIVPTNEGSTLSYFSDCPTSGESSKRAALRNGASAAWFLRTPCCVYNPNYPILSVTTGSLVTENGSFGSTQLSASNYLRPVMVLYSETPIDSNFNVLE